MSPPPRKKPLGSNGKRIICHKEHLSRLYRTFDIRQYVRENLAQGTSTVHVFQDLAGIIDQLSQRVEELFSPKEQEDLGIGNEPEEINQTRSSIPELAEFERLMHDVTPSDPAEIHALEETEATVACNHIASGMATGNEPVDKIPSENWEENQLPDFH